MGDTVTVAAFREFLMNLGAVRHTMAALTLGDLAMLWMTLGTAEGRVLCDIIP